MSELALQLIAENKRTKNTFLDLGNCGLTKLPDELFECVWLTGLNFGQLYYDRELKKIIGCKNHRSNNNFYNSNLSLLKSLIGLQTLYLSWNQITDISFLENLTGLQTLDLSRNKITDYSFLENLTGLQTLDLSGNQIANYSFLEKLTGLQTLDLSVNQITDISFLENLTGLQTLDLSGNEITDISSLENLTGLQTLELGENHLADISIIKNLTGLQTLDIGDNHLADISIIKNLTGLQTLDVSDNQITDYSSIENLKGLQTLDVSGTQITDYSFFKNLTGLLKLDLSGTQITDYSFLEKLTGLQILNLGGTQITDYSFLEKLTRLQELNLSWNKITDISILEKLIGLQTLNLNNNKITDISFLEKLTGLQTLNLGNNKITDINSLEKLAGLRSLDLSNNRITDISPILSLIKCGVIFTLMQYGFSDSINLFDNPITTPPIHIAEQGNEAIIRYFEEIKNGEEKGIKPKEMREVKVIFVGEGYSGKTTLMKRLLGLPVDEREVQTQGIRQETWIIKDEKGDIKANLWDFGGQEIQHNAHQFFLTEDCFYVLVLDNRKEEQPEYWLQHIISLGKNSSIFVVSNKVDIPEHAIDRFNQDFLKRKYSNIERFYKISALQGSNIETFKEDLSNAIRAYKFPVFGANWIDVKYFVEKEIEIGKNFIRSSQLHQFCDGIIRESDESIILNYLKKMGRVSYYQNNLTTRNFYILNPEWLIYAIYKIILSEKTIKNDGEIHIDDFDEILCGQGECQLFELNNKYSYNKEDYGYLLEMMKEYKLCYTADNKVIIIPSAFKEQFTPSFVKNENSLSFYFHYIDFIPVSIISQFIAKMFSYKNGKNYWRRGIELYDADTKSEAYIEMDKERRRINIEVNGEQRRKFFEQIRIEFRNLNKSFDQMKVEERIPLKSRQSDQSVEYISLINHELDHIAEYYHSQTRERFSVAQLLASIESKKATEEYKEHISYDNRSYSEYHVNITENNTELNISEMGEIHDIRELLLGLQKSALENKEWQGLLIKCLDEFKCMEEAEDKLLQGKSKKELEGYFSKLKNFKDAVGIGLLAVDINEKLPKLFELWDKFAKSLN